MPDCPVIHWFRRDLRIADNMGLFHASRSGGSTVPVYFASEWRGSHHWTGPKRQHFLCGCLASLDANLQTLGGRLIVRTGDPVDGLRQLIRETRAGALHFNKDPDPHGKEIEKRVRAMCRETGIECHAHDDVTLHTPDEVLNQSGLPYRVYTPYSRNWLALDKPQPVGKPARLNTPAGIRSLPLPDVSQWGLAVPDAQLVEPGERAARQRMKHAVRHIIGTYDNLRNLPAADGTSRISQDLRHGLLSIRRVYAECVQAAKDANTTARHGIEVYIKELAWREFYMAILHHFPSVLDEEFNPDWRGLPWDEPGGMFELWKQGRTGFPIVDAGMRELLATGHMHNRVRMITAMFLTKDLHHDWKLGESHFMQHLVDGEIASNNGGWQWSAGTGADAAPYFRIQNPWSQTTRYDPQGEYIKRWVPELKQVDPARFTEPPKNGRPIASDYPLPCLDHKTERERTLAIFARHRGAGR